MIKASQLILIGVISYWLNTLFHSQRVAGNCSRETVENLGTSMDDRAIIEQLQQASQGLLWLSESDYPFEIVYWQEENSTIKQKLLQNSHDEPNKTLETITLEKFFKRATCKQDWQNQTEKEEVDRYQNLVQLLQEKLTEITVYRVGETEIDIYILGKTESGAICGLSTKVIET